MRFIRFIAACTVALTFAIPASAATTPVPGCDCYCTSAKGATLQTPRAANRPACDTACQTKGEKVVTCSTSPADVPSNNPRCFDDADSCKSTCDGPPVPNKQPSGYIYDSGSQPRECPEKSHYCYCTGESYKLAHSIGGTSTVNDIGSYVNTVYKFLLGFAVTVAIVMVMIGGLQYVLAAGGDAVKIGKERIQNAVVGLILLFCAALILQTVNPRLLTLQPPRLPAIKRIDEIKPGTDCASLIAPNGKGELGKDATDGKKCGSKETVVKDKNGNPAPAGTVCMWKTCGPGEGCFVGDKGYCLKCGDVVPNNPDIPVIPRSSVCSSLALPSKDPIYNYCFWTRDPYALFGLSWSSTKTGLKVALAGALTGTGAFLGGPFGAVAGGLLGAGVAGPDIIALQGGTCAALKIDCSTISKCEDYNGLEITNKVASDSDLMNISADWGDLGMKTICTDNHPCRKKIGYGCNYVASSNTCATSSSTCSADSDCQEGFTCNLTVHTCTQIHRCNTDAECVSGDKCVSGRCITPDPNAGKNGQSCKIDGSCDLGLRCITRNVTTSDKVCSNLQVGSACASNDDCVSNAWGQPTCVNKVCSGSTGKAQGEACTTTGQCASGLSCTNNVCSSRTLSPQGGACVTTNDCVSGLACRNGVCGVGTPGGNGTRCITPSDCQSGFICAGPGIIADCNIESCLCSDKTVGAPCFISSLCTSTRCSQNTIPYADLGTCQP